MQMDGSDADRWGRCDEWLHKMMKMKKTIIYQMMLGMVLLLGMVLTLGLTGCSESGDDDGSSGKGSVAIRLRTQYVHATRATGDWADPTNTIEKIHDYKVVFVDGAGKVAAIATGNANGAEEHTFRYLLAPGTYTVYGFANFDGHTTLATDGNRAVSYDRLGITFESYNGESFYNDKMQPILDLLTEKGLLVDSEGAKVVNVGDDMPPCLLVRSDGATLYATRDLAAA